MSRRQRQLDEIHALCRAGAVGRAVDLAFDHVACFGDDGTVVDLLGAAVDHLDADERTRRRFAELLAADR